MLALGPLSSAAVSALPDYALGTQVAAFDGVVTYEGLATSPYRQLIATASRIVYTAEIAARVVR